ncbi:tripeptidyl-peptidase 2 [Quercus suber]|uniref:Tripeptidyl-peptidase 2 n=1 Tax=Quercus suber TaxID=58331 RepID=A0AAW0MBT7_QUESU
MWEEGFHHSVKGREASSLASSKDLEITRDQSQPESGVQPDLFEENFKELKKWALNDIIQDDGEPPKKKLYELKLSLLDEIGWCHLATYERQWMHVRFPASLPLF